MRLCVALKPLCSVTANPTPPLPPTLPTRADRVSRIVEALEAHLNDNHVLRVLLVDAPLQSNTVRPHTLRQDTLQSHMLDQFGLQGQQRQLGAITAGHSVGGDGGRGGGGSGGMQLVISSSDVSEHVFTQFL